jgi:hypothetical protein
MLTTSDSSITMANGPAVAGSQAKISEQRIAIDYLHNRFGVPFALVDTAAEKIVYTSPDTERCRWGDLMEVCRAVARRGRPEYIVDDDLLLLLAIPIPSDALVTNVAVAAFIGRPVENEADVAGAAQILGIEPRDALRWAARQTPGRSVYLMRMAEMALDKLSIEVRARSLTAELQVVSEQLTGSHEEISLLHRVAQNLHITRSDAQIGAEALAWMSAVVPAEGFALRLNARDGEARPGVDVEKNQYLFQGEERIAPEKLDAIIDYFKTNHLADPVVLNPPTTDQADWPARDVRQVVAAPLSEGVRTFGWIVAFNTPAARTLERSRRALSPARPAFWASTVGIRGCIASERS